MRQNNLGLYAHFPWCVRKCPYCDFNSHPLQTTSDFATYCNALVNDWRAQLKQFALDPTRITTLFLGGGTPSLFTPDHLAHVLTRLALPGVEEVTMEANPGTTEYTDFAAYRNVGINRLSIGAQSFNDNALTALGRIHKADETKHAFANARAGGFANINLDLMWGLPDQTVEDALDDLDTAITLQPEHISWYQLTIEPKTEFAQRPPILPKDDTLYRIEQAGLEHLAKFGYTRYEVSAFAQPDRECRHNVNYWSFGDYVGIGAGAHGKLTRSSHSIVRTRKAHQPRVYQRQPNRTEVHEVDSSELTVEFMMNTLRLTDGVAFEVFEQATGLEWSSVQSVWQTLASKGLVREDRIATTAQGLRFLDSVVAEFL